MGLFTILVGSCNLYQNIIRRIFTKVIRDAEAHTLICSDLIVYYKQFGNFFKESDEYKAFSKLNFYYDCAEFVNKTPNRSSRMISTKNLYETTSVDE